MLVDITILACYVAPAVDLEYKFGEWIRLPSTSLQLLNVQPVHRPGLRFGGLRIRTKRHCFPGCCLLEYEEDCPAAFLDTPQGSPSGIRRRKTTD
jgi:hypothetical protein